MLKNKIKNFPKRVKIFGLKKAINHLINVSALKWGRHIYKKPMAFKIHKYRMLLDPTDPGLSSALIEHREREKQVGFILESGIRPGQTIIDLGANIGYYALMMGKLVGSTGTVYALEPSTDNLKLLKRNIKLNDMEEVVEVYNLAGGNACGTERMFMSTSSNLHTMIPHLYRCGDQSRDLSGKSIEVKAVDLSSFLRDKKNVDLIRMDIEGYEVEVLEGLFPAIEAGKFTGKILFECHFPKYDDKEHSMRRQLNRLYQLNYRPKIMTSDDEKTSYFHEKGYQPAHVIQTDLHQSQGIYYNVKPQDAEYFICDAGGVRDVLFEKT